MSNEKKTKKKSRTATILLLILMLVCLGVFGFSAYKILSQKAEDSEGEAVYEEIEQIAGMGQSETPETVVAKPGTRSWSGEKAHSVVDGEEGSYSIRIVDFDALRKKNGEIIGWLEIPDTVVNYPVVQAENNDKYLRHLLNGSYHRFGTLFFDYRQDLSGDQLNDEITYIYGHNIRAGDMFHTIQFYTKQSYYEEHPYAVLYMPEDTYVLEFFAMVTINENDNLRFSFPQDAQGYLDGLKRKSIFDSATEVTDEDRIVGLFTCTNEDHSERYILFGKVIPLDLQ